MPKAGLKKTTELHFEIFNKTKGNRNLIRLPFELAKEEILGKKYILTLIFIGPTESKRLNNIYRKKNHPTNILSFPLDKNTGEIYITPEVAKKEFKNFEMNFENFILYLFIHGLLHLKGMDHGSKMDRKEKTFFEKFKK